MKIAVNRLIRNEKGQAMVLVVILLLVGGLIVSSLLSYMGNGLLNGQVYERRTAELYAADAGVEDAVWKIQNREVVFCPGNPTHSYNITDVNGKSVGITITSVNVVNNVTFGYRVVSTATDNNGGTQVDAYIAGVNKYGDYSGILGNVLTSQGDIVLKPGTNVTPSEGEHSPVENYPYGWPKLGELEEFYADNVTGGTYYYSDTSIDLNGVDQELGSLYVQGTLTIKNSSNTPATLTLTGTIYATGDTSIAYGTSNNKPMNLDLNDQTIFVASNSTGSGQEALKIGDKCTVIGSGVIIAIGDIYFKPNTEAGVTDPIFVMSVVGTSLVQPGGNFYGAIAGSVEIDLQPGTSINYPTEEGWYDDLNFLTGVRKLVYSIASWEVSQL
jgi:hypothetical protein